MRVCDGKMGVYRVFFRKVARCFEVRWGNIGTWVMLGGEVLTALVMLDELRK